MNITLVYLITTDNGELPEFATNERLLAVVDNEKDLHTIVDKYHTAERNYKADKDVPQYLRDMYDTEIRTEEVTLNQEIK